MAKSRPGIKADLARDVDSAGAHARAAHTAATGEQLALLDDERATEARMPLPEPPGAAARPAGRPAGAQNVRTRVVADYYLHRYGDPLEALLRLGMRPVSDLVGELQGVADATGVRLIGKNQSLKDLVQVQMHALEAALPYLRQRMPLAVDVETTRRDVLILGVPTPDQHARAAALGIDLGTARAPVESVQYQELSDDDGAPSPHGTAPDDRQAIDIALQSGDAAHD